MVCEGSRGFAISLRACDLIREPERKSKPGRLLHDGVTEEWRDNSWFVGNPYLIGKVRFARHPSAILAQSECIECARTTHTVRPMYYAAARIY